MNTNELSSGAFIALIAGIRARARELDEMIRDPVDVAYWNRCGRDLLEAATALGFSHVIREEIGEIPESWKPEVPA
jgi:hypothetical protein